jgi:long-chain-fatty-acyl-CoA reductase
MTALELPIIVLGKARMPEAGDRNVVTVRYESGIEVVLPRPSPADIAALRSATNSELHALSIDDISIFLTEVGKRLTDPNSPLRKEAVEHASRVTGYAARVVEYDFFVIGAALTRAKIYDMLATELGDPYYLDEWRPAQAVYRHAAPRGKVLHVMVGNVPMAALFTMVRSIVTKNLTVAKLPMRDLVTSLYFAKACIEVDPNHPVTRSLSVLYWEGGSAIEDQFIDMADVVCVWGQKSAVDSIRRKTSCGQEFIEFGPRRSYHLLGRDTADWDYAAMKAAYDISIYDQEACFSPQAAFVEGDAGPFVAHLETWMNRYLDVLPKGFESEDVRAHVSQKRMEAKLSGHKVITPKNTAWSIILADAPAVIHEHPLSRTLYVFPVADLREALPWITRDAQTVTVHPFARASELATEIARRGANRIVDIGRAGRPRPGFVHDGMFPLTKMVRWASLERPLSFKYHFVADDPEVDDRMMYGWQGAAKEPRSYRFSAVAAAYGFRPGTANTKGE